jgi:biotin operon repressor
MLSAEEYIKQHKAKQSKKPVLNTEVRSYDLKFYRSRNEIARELNLSRQTVAKRMGDLGFHMVWVKTKSGNGVRYYVKDQDIIKFAFYLLNR